MIELCVVKTPNNTLAPDTPVDAEKLRTLTVGKPYKLKVTQMSSRSYQHHKLFFGGLLQCAYDYWQPETLLVTDNEKWMVREFAKRLEAMHNTNGLIQSFADEFIQLIAQKRSEKTEGVRTSIDSFRAWLTEKAGYYDVEWSPDGYRKVPKSISFANMPQEEFNRFYKACFEVCWGMMLQHKFKDEDEAQAAIEQLSAMGN